MAAIPDSVQKIIEEYLMKISEQVPAGRVILFGSCAKGTFCDGSDIDIAVFSDYFSGMERVNAFKILYMPSLEFDADIQPLPFTEDDYRYPLGIAEEIIKTGIEIPFRA